MSLRNAMRDFNPSRREILGSIATTSVIGSIGTASATSSSELSVPDDTDVYIDGMDVATTSDVSTAESADLAVLGENSSVSDDEKVAALNNGSTVAIAKNQALRNLLRDISYSDNDVNYSFGYEMPSHRGSGLAVAHPASDGVLELQYREYGFRSDSESLDAAIEDYESLALQAEIQSNKFGSNFEREGNSTAVGKNCPGGDRARTVNYYVHTDEDGWVAWSWKTDMTPEKSSASECSDYWYNYWNRKNVEKYDFDGTIESWGPSTTSGTTSASVSLSIGEDGVNDGASWSYSVPDTRVLADKDNYDNAIQWEHQITPGTYQAKHTFDCEPGAIVKFNSGRRYAGYNKETKSLFFQPKWDNYYPIETDTVGLWPL